MSMDVPASSGSSSNLRGARRTGRDREANQTVLGRGRHGLYGHARYRDLRRGRLPPLGRTKPHDRFFNRLDVGCAWVNEPRGDDRAEFPSSAVVVNKVRWRIWSAFWVAGNQDMKLHGWLLSGIAKSTQGRPPPESLDARTRPALNMPGFRALFSYWRAGANPCKPRSLPCVPTCRRMIPHASGSSLSRRVVP